MAPPRSRAVALGLAVAQLRAVHPTAALRRAVGSPAAAAATAPSQAPELLQAAATRRRLAAVRSQAVVTAGQVELRQAALPRRPTAQRNRALPASHAAPRSPAVRRRTVHRKTRQPAAPMIETGRTTT